MQIIGPGANAAQPPTGTPNDSITVDPKLAAARRAQERTKKTLEDLNRSMRGGEGTPSVPPWDLRQLTGPISDALAEGFGPSADKPFAEGKVAGALEESALKKLIALSPELVEVLGVIPKLVTSPIFLSQPGGSADATLEAEIEAKRIAGAKPVLNMPPMWAADP